MNYLFDTCVISEVQSKTPNPKILTWINGIEDERIYISCITIGEIKRGIVAVSNETKRTRLIRWYEDDLLARFGDHILNIDTPTMEKWGGIAGELDKTDQAVPLMDSLIAATAIHKRLAIVTRNDRDFIKMGARIVNPWTL